jgi:hypothetical protein
MAFLWDELLDALADIAGENAADVQQPAANMAFPWDELLDAWAAQQQADIAAAGEDAADVQQPAAEAQEPAAAAMDIPIHHSTYDPANGRVGNGWADSVDENGDEYLAYTAAGTGRRYDTRKDPPGDCFNCGGCHWRKDCPFRRGGPPGPGAGAV